MSTSKHLIERSRQVSEAIPPGVTSPGGAPDPEEFDPASVQPQRPQPRPGGPRRLPSDATRVARHGGEGQMLKDALLIVLASRNDLDRGIVEKLMANKALDPGELQHILDEAGPLIDSLPEHIQAGLRAVYQRMQGGDAGGSVQ